MRKSGESRSAFASALNVTPHAWAFARAPEHEGFRMSEGSKRSIMAIGAHHDDNELIAGTLSLHKSMGWNIISVVVTDGQWIRGKVAPEHVKIREAESVEAAALLGMQCVFLRLPEGQLQCSNAERRIIIEEIRKHQPEIVVTHPPHDYHIDHEMTSRVVEAAVAQSSNACVVTETVPCHARPILYYSDAWFESFEPDEYVDITEQMDLKLRMLSCHRSQLPLHGSEEGDMIDLARLQSRFRGVAAGVRYAEAFRIASRVGLGLRKSFMLGKL